MQEIRATRHEEKTRACFIGVVRLDQPPTSYALTFDALVGSHFGMSNLVGDMPDAGEHALVVALDDQAQRDDIELVVVEATETYARNLGENGE